MSQVQTVVITGGNKGIGKATALAFANKGFNVVISSRDVSKAPELVEEIERAGGKGLVVKTDVRKEEDIINLINQAVEEFGKIDVLVNNAGITGDNTVFMADSTTEGFYDVLNTNLMGTYWGMKYAIKEMLKTGGGNIVNVSSLFAEKGAIYFAQVTASKHAINGLSKATALEYATQGIRVNVVNPGPVYTDVFTRIVSNDQFNEEGMASLTATKTIGRPEDVAKGILYLADKDNIFVTGTVLNIDGGISAQ